MKNWFLEQLAMYAAYHQDGRNQATHHVGVPMIVFALLVAASTVSLGPVTLAMPLISAMLVLYLINVPAIGVIATGLYGVLTFAAMLVVGSTGEDALLWALGLFVLGWIIQFVGHIFEGRKPALFDNLTQVFMAPAFLIAEVLFSGGMAKDLHAEILARQGKYLKDEDIADQSTLETPTA